MLCDWCKKEFDETAKPKTTQYRIKQRGYGYCCRECAENARRSKQVWTEERRRISSETMKRTNEKYHEQFVERMKTSNPMKNLDVRQSVSKRLKEIGHHPKIRCGNGQGLTVPQQKLMLALAENQIEVYAEYPIPTKMPRDSGYPTCYKVDIALPEYMVAVEVDGRSHCAIARQEQDEKKDSFLNGLGWQVLRFKNKQVMEHLADCVKTAMSTISK